jgi:hypothetical protein
LGGVIKLEILDAVNGHYGQDVDVETIQHRYYKTDPSWLETVLDRPAGRARDFHQVGRKVVGEVKPVVLLPRDDQHVIRPKGGYLRGFMDRRRHTARPSSEAGCQRACDDPRECG